ncbi:MAG: hypothetical protein PHR47_00630 [Candidatus Pacebacteria bacterium]|nr:hypothetical protein [Candidatus Paceibacterota bacterium]
MNFEQNYSDEELQNEGDDNSLEQKEITSNNAGQKKELVNEEDGFKGWKWHYGRLTDAQKSNIKNAQKEAENSIIEYVQGKTNIEGLSNEEELVLNKIRDNYSEFKQNNPNQPFQFDFIQGADKETYDELEQKMILEALEGHKEEGHKEENNSKSNSSESQEVNGDNTIEEKDYSEFKVKNGETDTDVFWYQFSNTAAKKMEKQGNFEWGKERIYFDVPLDQMEKLRDIVFTTAKDGHIPIAFKYLDTSKTSQIDLKEGSETTRFVANFASVHDARKFYEILIKNEQYKEIKPDRTVNYYGYNLDNLAHYASGYREKREALKRIRDTAQKIDNENYIYDSSNGKKKIKITKLQYEEFMKQLNELPDPKNTWNDAENM